MNKKVASGWFGHGHSTVCPLRTILPEATAKSIHFLNYRHTQKFYPRLSATSVSYMAVCNKKGRGYPAF
jgi:hypothetical protein